MVCKIAVCVVDGERNSLSDDFGKAVRAELQCLVWYLTPVIHALPACIIYLPNIILIVF